MLIEPDPNDELMFATNIMNYAKRIEIARHGFESVTIKLAKDYDNFHAICARHGIEISATRVRRVIKRFADRTERMRYVVCDLRDPAWEQGVPAAGAPYTGIALPPPLELPAAAPALPAPWSVPSLHRSPR